MTKKATIFIVVILAILVAGFFIYSNLPSEKESKEVNFKLQPTKSVNDSYINPVENEKKDDQTDEVFIPGTSSDIESEPGYISSSDEINILVDMPEQGDILTSPFVVSGEARVFEGTVIVQVTNISGKVLIEEVVTAHSLDVGQFGSFKVTLGFSFSQTKEGFVEVFSESARDGTQQNLVKIPVKFE